MSLKGKVVFITGASAGIGAATALAFVAEGTRLLLAARRASFRVTAHDPQHNILMSMNDRAIA